MAAARDGRAGAGAAAAGSGPGRGRSGARLGSLVRAAVRAAAAVDSPGCPLRPRSQQYTPSSRGMATRPHTRCAHTRRAHTALSRAHTAHTARPHSSHALKPSRPLSHRFPRAPCAARCAQAEPPGPFGPATADTRAFRNLRTSPLRNSDAPCPVRHTLSHTHSLFFSCSRLDFFKSFLRWAG